MYESTLNIQAQVEIVGNATCTFIRQCSEIERRLQEDILAARRLNNGSWSIRKHQQHIEVQAKQYFRDITVKYDSSEEVNGATYLAFCCIFNNAYCNIYIRQI